jgi:predicted nucleic acid-binding protein
MVVDTSIFIDFLRKKDKTQSVLYSISEVVPLAISSVTLNELSMGATDDSKRTDVKILNFKHFERIPGLKFYS